MNVIELVVFPWGDVVGINPDRVDMFAERLHEEDGKKVWVTDVTIQGRNPLAFYGRRADISQCLRAGKTSPHYQGKYVNPAPKGELPLQKSFADELNRAKIARGTMAPDGRVIEHP